MKAYSINPQEQTLKEIDIEILADTAYSFFGSLLIDEASTIAKHVVYSDANALNEKKVPFFLGGQLVVGDALIVGREGLEDLEASIPLSDLETLVSYDVPDFYTQVIELIASSNINLYRAFAVQQNGENVDLSIEWVLYTFNIADSATQEYFIAELQKVLNAQEDVAEYMKKMAQLAVNAI